MEQLLKLFGSQNLLAQQAEKYTLLIDEKQVVSGALFFLETKGKSYKVLVAAPHHEDLLRDGTPTIETLLKHRQAMYLK